MNKARAASRIKWTIFLKNCCGQWIWKLLLVVFMTFSVVQAQASTPACLGFFNPEMQAKLELDSAKASHETRGAIFNKVKELAAENKASTESFREYINSDERNSGKIWDERRAHHLVIIHNLSKEVSDLIAIELTRRGHEVEVFQPPASNPNAKNLHSYRAKVTSFPQSPAGNFWRNLQRQYGHELIFDVVGEVVEGRRGGVDEKYLYHTVNSILAEAPERSITLFHEIVHLNERQKIKALRGFLGRI